MAASAREFKAGDKVFISQSTQNGSGHSSPVGTELILLSKYGNDASQGNQRWNVALTSKPTTAYGWVLEREILHVSTTTDSFEEQLEQLKKRRTESDESFIKQIAELTMKLEFVTANGGEFNESMFRLWRVTQEIEASKGDNLILAGRLAEIMSGRR